MPALLHVLSKDCPKRRSLSAYDLCGVHCASCRCTFAPLDFLEPWKPAAIYITALVDGVASKPPAKR
jgi:hypothetical protein